MASSAGADRDGRRKSRPRKLTYSEQQELEQIEARIEALETQKTNLQADINSSGSDYIKLQTLAGQLQELEAKLERFMERWLELSEVADGASN